MLIPILFEKHVQLFSSQKISLPAANKTGETRMEISNSAHVLVLHKQGNFFPPLGLKTISTVALLGKGKKDFPAPCHRQFPKCMQISK